MSFFRIFIKENNKMLEATTAILRMTIKECYRGLARYTGQIKNNLHQIWTLVYFQKVAAVVAQRFQVS